MPKAVLSPTEAAFRLGVSEATIWRAIRRGDLPSTKVDGVRLIPRSAVTSSASTRSRLRLMSDLHIALRQRALSLVKLAVVEGDSLRRVAMLDLAADLMSAARGHALREADAALHKAERQQ